MKHEYEVITESSNLSSTLIIKNYKILIIYKYILVFFLSFIFYCFLTNTKNKIRINEIIKENFFIIDSNYLKDINSHLYGYIITKKGILTDNYFKALGNYGDPEPLGVYVMIKKTGDILQINQDFNGAFGLYIYENKTTDYFVISNSFLLLEEYLIGKQYITLNKEYADNFIVSSLCSCVIQETIIREIICLPSNVFIKIDIKKKLFKLYHINYKENTIPLESEEGMKIIDKWIDKWGNIFRSLKNQTNNIIFDLTGGFHTRAILSILLNSNIDIKDILIMSIDAKFYKEDFEIASNIASKLGFKLNNIELDRNVTMWNSKDSLLCSIYSKLGFHKWFLLQTRFYNKPRFHITGEGGELISGYPNKPIDKYITAISSRSRNIKGHQSEFYNSSMKILNRSVTLLKKERSFENNYEIANLFYTRGRNRNHYGKTSLERFLANEYTLSPLIDPDIKQIKYNINSESQQDLIAYIYIRLSDKLVNFPFSSKRILNPDCIKKAKKLNKLFVPYRIKKDYNYMFYIDKKRISPVSSYNHFNNITEYLNKLLKSPKFEDIVNKIYDINTYKCRLFY